MDKKVTIHDIAKLLNVNSSTVSRALNNSNRVTPKTKEKVIAKANELGYQRNHLASNLRKNKSYTIGVIVPRISRHFFSSAISGIEETAYENGYKVIICQSLESQNREKDIVETFMANRVDGVLVSISMKTKDVSHFEALKKSGIPFVFFDRHYEMPNTSKVLIDDFRAGFMATEHLIQNGCKKIAHFSGPQELEIYKNRKKGYLSALEQYHIPVDEKLIIYSPLMQDDGEKNMKKLLSIDNQVDGVFAANDVSAIGAIKYLKKKNISIPNDVAIIGFSNEPISSIIEPSLSTIDQSGFEIGKNATNLILTQIKEKKNGIKNKTILLQSNLIVRTSTQKIPLETI